MGLICLPSSPRREQQASKRQARSKPASEQASERESTRAKAGQASRRANTGAPHTKADTREAAKHTSSTPAHNMHGISGGARQPRRASREQTCLMHHLPEQQPCMQELREPARDQQGEKRQEAQRGSQSTVQGRRDHWENRLRHARAFSLWRVIERRCWSIVAQERSVKSSPVAKAEDLASSDQTPFAILPQLPPTASMTIGMNVIP